MESTSNLYKKMQSYRLALIILRKHNKLYFLFIVILIISHCASLLISFHLLSSSKMTCFRSSSEADMPHRASISLSVFEPITTCR
jgi:hypothetical protein